MASNHDDADMDTAVDSPAVADNAADNTSDNIADDNAPETRTNLAIDLLLQSPPGEGSEVADDIRLLLNDDEALESVRPAFRQRNLEEMHIVELATLASEKTLLSVHNESETGDYYYDQRLKVKFAFDHISMTATSIEPFEDVHKLEGLRKCIDSELQTYVKELYPTGVAATFSRPDSVSDGCLFIKCVGNRFKPRNFWNGQWKSAWTVDPAKGLLTGSVKIQVHYFEDGNVQLNTSKTVCFQLAQLTEEDGLDGGDGGERCAKYAAEVLANIRAFENEVQLALNEAYAQMAESTFKRLRRVLPVTRAKLDWAKMSSYKVGDELVKPK